MAYQNAVICVQEGNGRERYEFANVEMLPVPDPIAIKKVQDRCARKPATQTEERMCFPIAPEFVTIMPLRRPPMSELARTSGRGFCDPSGWCGVYFVVVTEDKEHDSREISRSQGWLGVYFDNTVRVEGGPDEVGNRIVLEWKGTTSLVVAPPDGSELDTEQIKQRVKKLLTTQD